MKLVLCIKGHYLAEVEVAPLTGGENLNFQQKTEIKQFYIQQLVKGFKIRYQKAIEYKRWEVFLIAESKVHLINEV